MKIAAFRGWAAFAKRLIPIVSVGVLTGYLSACNFSIGGDPSYPNERDKTDRGAGSDSGTVFGEGGLFGGGKSTGPDNGATGVGVNSLLWRASLDTISFMPLVSADPFGGVIITDWYTPPQTPDERFKATVYILDTRLRADALKVAIFKQQLTGTGWQDAPTDAETGIQIENAILTKARQYKLSTIG